MGCLWDGATPGGSSVSLDAVGRGAISRAACSARCAHAGAARLSRDERRYLARTNFWMERSPRSRPLQDSDDSAT
jgi:hypothetical protein